MDELFEQFATITKAHAYEIMREKATELQEENDRLKARVKYLEDLIKEYCEKMTANLTGQN